MAATRGPVPADEHTADDPAPTNRRWSSSLIAWPAGSPVWLVDDHVAADCRFLRHAIVRDEQEFAATSSRLLGSRTFPPDHVESG
jgi:hypothetical protein